MSIKKKAYLFSFVKWVNAPTKYILVYATNEKEARQFGCKECHFNNGKQAEPSDLTLATYGI